jgi:holo-[acyl-carrier protein] synthase
MSSNKIASRHYRSYVASQGEVSIGVDLASVSRIAKMVDRYDSETLTLIFTPDEIDRAQASDSIQKTYAIYFAAKEAVGKAMGTGLLGIDWHEIEVKESMEQLPKNDRYLSSEDFQSQLKIKLSGKARVRSSKLGFTNWFAHWLGWDDYILVRILAY